MPELPRAGAGVRESLPEVWGETGGMMANEIDILHCKVLAMRQECEQRRKWFLNQGEINWYNTERHIGLELDRVLRLFDDRKPKV